MNLLANVRSNTICTIQWMLGLPEEASRKMKACKIEQGSQVRVIQNNGAGLIIGAGGKRIAMAPALARKIRV